MEMYEASGGLFDITVGPLVDVWDVVGRGGLIEGPPVWDWLGGLSRRKGPPSPDEIDAAMELVGADKLVLDGAAHSVFFTREGMILDPGGIAKGYALDRAEEALRSGGVEAGIIDLISTSVVIGDKPEAAGGPLWIFAIQDPRSAGHLAEFTLSGNTYFSTSGDNQRFFEYEGVRYHHILDPRTGYPAGGTMAVTVVGGPSGAWSDAMSTATFIMGYPEGMTWAEAVEGVQVVMVDPDGVVHTTPSLDPSLLFIKEKAGAGSG
jgi:thiamine biosynthesis lipoprotein